MTSRNAVAENCYISDGQPSWYRVTVAIDIGTVLGILMPNMDNWENAEKQKVHSAKSLEIANWQNLKGDMFWEELPFARIWISRGSDGVFQEEILHLDLLYHSITEFQPVVWADYLNEGVGWEQDKILPEWQITNKILKLYFAMPDGLNFTRLGGMPKATCFARH